MRFLTILTVALLILVVFTACSSRRFNSSSKNNPFIDRYNDKMLAGEEKIFASYQHLTSKKGDQYIGRTFFPETRQITVQEVFSDAKFQTLDGPSKYWSDEGVLIQEGSFKSGLKTGTWKIYDLDGDLIAKEFYDAGALSGKYEQYHSNGQLKISSNYLMGKLDGDYSTYDSTGIKKEILTYEKGKLISGGTDPGDLKEEMPQFKGCEDITNYNERYSCASRLLLEYIYGNIRYPARAREYDVQGTARSTFVIEKDGTVSNIKVINGLNADIRDEVLRIINGMPKWNPGYQMGKPVKVQFNLPIKFKLE